MSRLEWIRTNYIAFDITLSNWIYRTSDKFEFIYKQHANPVGEWPAFLFTEHRNIAAIIVQYNLYFNRRVMNFGHGGSWSGDSSYSYSSPLDNDNYYKIVVDGSDIGLFKGADMDDISERVITATLGTISDTDTLPIKFLPSVSSNSKFDIYFYSLKVWRNNILIHNYVPYSGGVLDLIDETIYTTSNTGYEEGPEWVPPAPPSGEFPVYIQRNNSEAIHLDKDLTDILTAYAWLKESTSIINPTFVLEASLSDLVRANYVTVPQFGRSYFVKDIVSITTDLLEVNCHVDVLSSFKDDIRANRGITHRQEERWNLHLNDGVLQAYQNPIITTQAFPNGFTENNFVLIAMGARGAGINPWGGYIDYDDIYVDEEGGGDGNNESRTTAGMYQYALAQVGKPYWFGTFGNLASATLLSSKRSQYPNQYPNPGNPDFTTQFGERVHDCVGLIKGYRWRGLDGLDPVYVPSEDVDVKGLWAQCTRRYGEVTPNRPFPPVGAVAFTANFDHCGVFAPSEGGFFVVIEAQGHKNGVVKNVGLTGKFKYWGVPDWMKVTTREV